MYIVQFFFLFFYGARKFPQVQFELQIEKKKKTIISKNFEISSADTEKDSKDVYYLPGFLKNIFFLLKKVISAII